MLQHGDKIGPYTLIRKLGQGAFGVVWLAEKRSAFMTQTVALKIPTDDEPDMDVIRREAEIWHKVSGHPNVLPVLDADMYDGQVIIVSEYAPDGTLLDWIKKHGTEAPSMESAVQMTMGILRGLSHLHSMNMIHRDLKPGNVLLKGETPCLTDFGLTRVLRTTAQTTNVSGTPAYMAPEMFIGKYSVQSDLWAVGVMLYRMLAGKLPFQGNSLWEWAEVIKTKPPKLLPDTIPASLRTIVGRALQKSPAARFTSALDMLDALVVASADVETMPSNTSQPSEHNLDGAPTLETMPVEPINWGNSRRITNRLILIAGICVCLSAFAGLTSLYFARQDALYIGTWIEDYQGISPSWKSNMPPDDQDKDTSKNVWTLVIDSNHTATLIHPDIFSRDGRQLVSGANISLKWNREGDNIVFDEQSDGYKRGTFYLGKNGSQTSTNKGELQILHPDIFVYMSKR